MLYTPPRVAKSQNGQSEQLVAKQMFMLFPTPMFMGNLPDLSVCDRIEQKLQELRKAGQGNFTPEGAVPAFMSRDDIQNLPEMQALVDVIMYESGQILDAYTIKRDSHYITNMWANIANPNRRHHVHIHPNCLLSGVVYIKTPPQCGPTMFCSPRQFAQMLEPEYTRKNELNADVFVMPAEKGRMLMWPSHVPHGVEQGTADESEERIVVAFNVMIRGAVERHTMRLEFH
jgi:uncharacterized protein (TIGR02466 family)